MLLRHKPADDFGLDLYSYDRVCGNRRRHFPLSNGQVLYCPEIVFFEGLMPMNAAKLRLVWSIKVLGQKYCGTAEEITSRVSIKARFGPEVSELAFD